MASIKVWVPRIKSQDDYDWGKLKNIFQSPNKDFHVVIKQLEERMSCNEEKRQVERRQAVWILVSQLNDEWISDEKRGALLYQLNQWNIDKSVFYEMKDTFQTYLDLYEQMERVESWDHDLKAELEKNKHELDASLKALIELG